MRRKLCRACGCKPRASKWSLGHLLLLVCLLLSLLLFPEAKVPSSVYGATWGLPRSSRALYRALCGRGCLQARGPPLISLKPPSRTTRAATPAAGCPFRYLEGFGCLAAVRYQSSGMARHGKGKDMRPKHAKAVSAKGVTRRPTKSEMPMMVAPMPPPTPRNCSTLLRGYCTRLESSNLLPPPTIPVSAHPAQPWDQWSARS